MGPESSARTLRTPRSDLLFLGLLALFSWPTRAASSNLGTAPLERRGEPVISRESRWLHSHIVVLFVYFVLIVYTGDIQRAQQVPRMRETMTTEQESFDDVVLPPSDNRQLRALDHLLHETTPPTLKGADGEETILPMEVYNVLVDVVAAMNKGMAIVLAPRNQRLTTREAADYLGVSRPTLVRLLENKKIPYDQPSRHRYVYLSDLAEYKQRRRHERRATLAEMTKDAAAAGLYDRSESAEEVAAAVKKVRKELADSAQP